MMVTVSKDAHLSIGMSPSEDSIHVEIGEHRDTIESIYLHHSKTVTIEWLAGGFRLKIK